MIHWAFLILSFIVGFVVCLAFLYWYSGLASEVGEGIEGMSEVVGEGW